VDTRKSARPEFQKYVDVGRFEEIPIEDRSKVEFRLRDQFRQRIKGGALFDEDAAEKSNINIDGFALSLLHQARFEEQLHLLKDNLHRAQGEVRADPAPKTLVPLYRAARTLDQALLGFDFDALSDILASTKEVVELKRKTDPSLDGNGATRQLLKRLEGHIKAFAKVKSDLANDPEFKTDANPDVSK
jgi:hypothetical protein